MEREVVLNWGTGGDWLDLKGSADVGEHGWPEWKRLRVVLLPSLVLGAKVESARMLQVWWKNNGLVTSLARKLHTEIPGIKSDEGEVQVLGDQVLVREGIEAGDSIPEGTGIANMLPGEGSQAG